MSGQYWEDLYEKGEMPWEKGEPSPGLVDYLNDRPGLPRGSVLVPGCGTGHDVRAWAKAGFNATGLDLAASAIRLSREKTEAMGLKAEFRQLNFLEVEPYEQFDYLFEHTLFCAIQPDQRDNYVEAVYRWLKSSGVYVAVFYMIPDKEGPPFGSTEDEIRKRFASRFELMKDWVPRSYPNRSGLEWMTIWKPKLPSENKKR
jgi:SAM-dependent methyltransferase